MRTIFRYKIAITDKSVLPMPCGAKVLPSPPGDRNNGAEIEIWAQVDTDAPLERRQFRAIGTGNPMSPAGLDRHPRPHASSPITRRWPLSVPAMMENWSKRVGATYR